jgi:hypothetical protein
MVIYLDIDVWKKKRNTKSAVPCVLVLTAMREPTRWRNPACICRKQILTTHAEPTAYVLKLEGRQVLHGGCGGSAFKRLSRYDVETVMT